MEEERRLEDDGRVPSIYIVKSALSIGALTGTSGLIYGAFAGIIRSRHPAIFAIASGVRCFALGTTFWGARACILNVGGTAETLPPRKMVYASTIAGAFSGAFVGAVTRGRYSVIPGSIMCGALGGLGQSLYHSLDASHTLEVADDKLTPAPSLWHKIADMKWSPMKVLSDDEYESMLREKLLRMDAEIAILDEDLARLKIEEGSLNSGDPNVISKVT